MRFRTRMQINGESKGVSFPFHPPFPVVHQATVAG